jgi:hypothetical protein
LSARWTYRPSENWRELAAKDSFVRKNCALLRANGIDPAAVDLTDLKATREDLIKKLRLKEPEFDI